MVQTAQFTETSSGEADSCDLLPPGVGDVYGQKGCCPLFGPLNHHLLQKDSDLVRQTSRAEVQGLVKRVLSPFRASKRAFFAIRLVLMTLCVTFIPSCNASHQIASDPVDYNRSAAKARDKMLLLNIARASNNMPMQFAAISSINGNVQSRLTSTANFPLVGSFDQSNFDATISGYFQHNPSYTLGLLDTQEFMRGVLDPVELETINHYLLQGWNPQLLAYLYIESFTVRKKVDGGDLEGGSEVKWLEYVLDNHPKADNFDVFQSIIRSIQPRVSGDVDRTLRIDKNSNPKAILTPIQMTVDELRNLPESVLVSLFEQEIDVQEIGDVDTGGEVKYQFVKGGEPSESLSLPSLSFDILNNSPLEDGGESGQGGGELSDPLREAVAEAFEKRTQIYLISNNEPGGDSKVESDNRTTQVFITPRSVQGMIYYLGELVEYHDINVHVRENRGEETRQLFEMTTVSQRTDGGLSVEYMDEIYTVTTENTYLSLIHI